MCKILIVDDDAELRGNLVELLENAGYRTETAASAKDALEKIQSCDFEIILLDFMMPGLNGIDALPEITRISPQSKVIMITAFGTIDNAINAIKSGAAEYITKPFKVPELLILIKQVLEERRFEGGVQKLKMENTLSSLSNSIRRDIIGMFHTGSTHRLMEIARQLGIEDHTKVIFHLKSLKESGIIGQHLDKSYYLTQEGQKVKDCLDILHQYLASG